MSDKLIDAWAVFSIGSMVLYAFTGLALWSRLGEMDAIRALLLLVFHVFGVMAAVFRRMQ